MEHPEHVTLLHDETGSEDGGDFIVRSGARRLYSTFEAVTSTTVQDEDVDEE